MIVLGQEEREWIDSIIETAYRDIQDRLNIENDTHVFEIMRESIERIEEEV